MEKCGPVHSDFSRSNQASGVLGEAIVISRPCGSGRRRYGGPVDVERAADLYAQSWTLRQIGAELGAHWSTVSQQLHQAGVTMRRGASAPPQHNRSCSA
jgi:hypothetical protein